MTSLNVLRTITPSTDEMQAAYGVFGDLPEIDDLRRLVMVRRAVAAGYYFEQLPAKAEESTLAA